MALPRLDRRQLLGGLAASTLPFPGQRRAQAREIVQLSQGMVPGRFGAVHYRFAKPVRPGGRVPLLCLHASPGSGVGYTNFVAEMAKDRWTIAADHPGFGLSDRPLHPSTIPDFAGAMVDLLDGLGIDRVDLVGSHTGSATAVELARQQPARVRRIVLHSALLFTPEEIADYKARLVGSVPESLDAAAKRLPDLWAKFGRFRAELGDDAAWQLFWEMNRDPLHMGWGHDAAFAYDFAATFKQLKQPILVLNPQEGLHPITARARGVGPNIEVVDLPWGDGLFSGHAVEVAAIIRKHLDG